jgi:hypothetical protein
MAIGWMIFKVKITQDCKKSKVEMYKIDLRPSVQV